MPRATRRWSPAKCLVAGSLSLGLVVGFVGATASLAAALPRAAGFQGGQSQPFPYNWRSTVKGTVASTATSPTPGFTLDVVGCSTPQFITTNGSTTYTEPGTGLTPTGVVSGEKVIVQLVRGASSLTAGRVAILLTQISGKVDSAGASQLLVTDQHGFQRTIKLDVNGTTTYLPTGVTVADGDLVNAFGTLDADHVSLDAVAVHVRSAPTSSPFVPPPSADHISGVVGTVTPGTSFVLAEAGGTTQIVTTTSSTTYFATGASSPPTGVISGEHVFVTLVSGSATPTAKTVFIILTELNGTVVSVGSDFFVLQDGQGFWRTVDVTDSTGYSPSGTTLGGLSGDHVAAFGTVASNLTDLDALYVDVLPTAASAWFNTQSWKSVLSGCPVTPQAWSAFGTTGAPHNAGSGDPQGAASASAGSWSTGPTSSSTSGRAWDSPGAGSFSGADHGFSAPQSSGINVGHGSFSGSPHGAGNAGSQGGSPDGGGSGGPGAGGGPGGGGPGGGR